MPNLPSETISLNARERFKQLIQTDPERSEHQRMRGDMHSPIGTGFDLQMKGHDPKPHPWPTGFFESGAAALESTYRGLLLKEFGFNNQGYSRSIHIDTEDGWDVYQQAPEGIGGTKYAVHADRFVGARSKGDMREIMRDINEAEERHRIMQGNPLGAFAGYTADWVTDPLNYIAVGLMRKAMTLGYVKPVRNMYGPARAGDPHHFRFNAKTKTWEYGPPKGPLLSSRDAGRFYVGLALAGSEVPREIIRQNLDPTATAAQSALIVGGQFLMGAAIGRGVRGTSTAADAIDEAMVMQERNYLRLSSSDNMMPPRWGPLAPDPPSGGSLPALIDRTAENVVRSTTTTPLATRLPQHVLSRVDPSTNKIHLDMENIAADYKANLMNLGRFNLEGFDTLKLLSFFEKNGGIAKYVEFITEKQKHDIASGMAGKMFVLGGTAKEEFIGYLKEMDIKYIEPAIAAALTKIGAPINDIWPGGSQFLIPETEQYIQNTARNAAITHEAKTAPKEEYAFGEGWAGLKGATLSEAEELMLGLTTEELLSRKVIMPQMIKDWTDALWSKGQWSGASHGLRAKEFDLRFQRHLKGLNDVEAMQALIEKILKGRVDEPISLDAARKAKFPGPGETRKGAGSQAAEEPPLSGTAWQAGFYPKDALGVEKLSKMTPFGRVISGEFPSLGELAVQLFTPPYTLQMHVAHISSPISVQSRMLAWNYPLRDALMYTDHQFLSYRLGDKAPAVDSVMKTAGAMARLAVVDKTKGIPTGFIGYLEFRERVLDVRGTGIPDSIPEINRVADFWGQRVYEPMGQSAVDQGILKAEQRRRDYINIIWDHSKIKTDRPGFTTVVQEGLSLNIADAEKVVSAVMKSRPFSSISEFDTGFASALHERSIKIPMTFVASNGLSIRDFIFKDIESVGKIFVRTLSADIELARTFGPMKTNYDETGAFVSEVRLGKDGVRMEAAIKNAYTDATEQIVSQAGVNAGPLVRSRIDKFDTDTKTALKNALDELQRTDDAVNVSSIHEKKTIELRDNLIKDLKGINSKSSKSMANLFNLTDDTLAMRDLIRGTFGQPDDPTSRLSRVMHGSKVITAMTLLFGPVWSAVPDIMMPVLHEGLNRTLGTTFDILSSDIRKEVWAMSKKDGQVLGEIMEMYLAARAISMTGVTDVAGRYSAFERGLDSANSFIFVANLFNPWNDFFKTWAGMSIWSRFLDDVLALHGNKGLSKRKIENLARGGISRTGITESGLPVDHIKIIAEQFLKHGRTHKSIRIANIEAWDKVRADGTPNEEVLATVAAVRQAITSDIQRTIITPSKADLPLWASTELGSVVAALKTFSFAAIQKILIPAMQERDRQAALGIFMLTAVGVVVENMKRRQRGDDRTMGRGEMLIAGVERGGVLGILMDFNRILETLTDNRIGLSPMVGAGPPYGSTMARKLTSVGGAVSTEYYNVGKFLLNGMTGNANMNDFERIFPMHGAFYLTPIWGLLNSKGGGGGFSSQLPGGESPTLPQTKFD